MPQFNIKQVRGSTQGSVLFLGTNARVSEDNSRFSWNTTNNSLLLGTSSIFGTERLRVYGNQRIDGDLFVTGSFSVLGSASVINTQNLTIQDPIILLASTQSGSPVLDSGFFINRGTGATQAFIWDESADEFVFIQTNDNSTVIGNVNISSYANIRANGATLSQIKITSGASSGYILVSDSVGLASWTSSIPNGVTGSGVVNYVPRWLSSTNLSATGSIYDNGSQVGIGTTAPTRKLHIVATYSGGGFRLEDTTQSNGYVLVSDANGVGTWTQSTNIFNGSTANNGLTQSGGFIQLGGDLIQNTTINNLTNTFNMNSSNADIDFVVIDGAGGGYHVKSDVNDGGSAFGSVVDTTANYNLIESLHAGNSTKTYLQTTDTVVTMWAEPDPITNVSIKLFTSDQVGGDGSTTNRMVVDDGVLSKGLIYAGDYTTQFTTYSLVTKGYVDSVVGASSSGVTGSGIANYVPYWLTTSQLTSGSIYDSGTAIGVGTVSNGSYRVNISGDVNINGTLYATSKSFEIEHPLDSSKRLTYGSLEGPEYGVYYRGKLERNSIIDLPDYWTGLVDESSITVNITPIGMYQRIFVDKIESNKVYLGVDNSGPPNCYYIVYAERKDIPKIIVE